MSTGTASPSLSKGAEKALGRSYVYKYLSLGFMLPEKKWWDLLQSGIWITGIRKETRSLYRDRTIRKKLRKLEEETEKVKDLNLEKLRIEHTRLFSLPGEEISLPYETEYTSPHPFMKSRELADILGFYRAFGVNTSETLPDRADFLATELEFMHFLCLKEMDARMKTRKEHVEIVRDAERKFLEDHLGRWLKPFGEGVRRNSKLGFYAALAEVTHTYIELECLLLGSRPESLSGPPAVSEGSDFCDTKCPLTSLEERGGP